MPFHYRAYDYRACRTQPVVGMELWRGRKVYSASAASAYLQMTYESQWERFEAVGPDGQCRVVQFVRAGSLTTGDQPELYLFHVAGEQVLVGISGGALRRFQLARRYLSREEKIDLAGAFLKRRIEAGAALEPQNLYLRDDQLAQLAADLSIPT